jgi:CubicO group peptidase (beta-lactamase class C family)
MNISTLRGLLSSFLVVAVLFIASVVQAQTPASSVDEIMSTWNSPSSPGASVVVVRDGKILFQKGYGSANLEYSIPITSDTTFHVASVSKEFTAMALVLLEQDGKLSLEDDVHKYLPELPQYGHTITIRNLLQHTSGIRDQWQALSLAGWRLDDVITQKQVTRVLYRFNELNFPPGDRFLYSNGAYTLAAEIVARVSGEPFAKFCKERIFEPLGMAHTQFHDDYRRLVPNRSYSYAKTKEGFEASPLNYSTVGATGLFTTTTDLSKWLTNFGDPKVGGKAGMARLQEEGVLNDGSKTGYALGLSVGEIYGLKAFSHPGSDAGYRAYIVWFPVANLGVAVLGNVDTIDAPGIGNKIAAFFLAKEIKSIPTKPTPARVYISLSESSLRQNVGVYRMNSGTRLEISSGAGTLKAGVVGKSKSDLKAVTPNRFYLDGAEAEFTHRPDGTVWLKVTQPNGAVRAGERIKYVPFDNADLPQYVGVYWSDELEAQYTMAIVDGRLVARHIRLGEISLAPIEEDRFIGAQWFMQEVRFTRDTSGRVDGVEIGAGGMKGIVFKKR